MLSSKDRAADPYPGSHPGHMAGSGSGPMIFDPRTNQDRVVPWSQLLPSSFSGPDSYGDDAGDEHSNAYRAFQVSRRSLLQNGFALNTVIDGPSIDVSAIFLESRLPFTHPISNFIIRLMRVFRWDPATRLALMHFGYSMLRVCRRRLNGSSRSLKHNN